MEGKEKSFGLTHHLTLMFQQTLQKHSYVLLTNIFSVHTKRLNQSPLLKFFNKNLFSCRHGDCRKESIVYKCTACTIPQLKKVYLRLTEGEFKTRYYKHSKSFRTKSYPNSTTLPSYVWEVKTDQN